MYSKVKLLIIVPARIVDIDLRHRARSSFGLCSMYDSTYPVAIRFYVANNASPMSKETWKLFQMEMSQFNDIVWDKGFIDSYRNLSMKMIRALRWSQIHFPKVWFVVKIDVDGFFSLPNLLEYLSKFIHRRFDNEETYYKNPPPVILGNILYRSNVIRKKSKWRVSNSEYPISKYPIYNQGYFYILNPQIISVIVRNFSNLYENKSCQTAELMEINSTLCPVKRPVLPMEDVFITGVLVENTSGIRRVNLFRFYCYNCKGKLRKGKIVDRYHWNPTEHDITSCTSQAEKFLQSFNFEIKPWLSKFLRKGYFSFG